MASEKKQEVIGPGNVRSATQVLKKVPITKHAIKSVDMESLKAVATTAHGEGSKCLAFPSLGTGILKFDPDKAAKIACDVCFF